MANWIHTYGFKNDQLPSFPFKLETLEHRNSYDASELHRHNYYEVFLFKNGGGNHLLDFAEIPITANSIHFLTPGMVHCVKRALTSDGYVMMFTDEFYYFNSENKNLLFELPFFHNNTEYKAFEPGIQEFDELCKLSLDMRRVYSSDHVYKLNLLQSYIHIFLLRCLQSFDKKYSRESGNDHSSASMLHKFKKMLEKNFISHHQVKDYAEMLNITPNHLNNICKQAEGKTASDIIQERLILEAKRLLVYSLKSAKEISFELHFDSPSHFSKFFKNKTSETPAGFVKSYEFVNRLR